MALSIARKTNQYLKAGTPIFVYELKSTETEPKKIAEDLAAYKKSQGDFYRESEAKQPVYFSQRPLENGAELTLTKSGRYQVLQDLEGTVAAREQAATVAFGKLEAIRQFTGLSKAAMQERLLSNF